MIKQVAKNIMGFLERAPNAFRRKRRVAELSEKKPHVPLERIEGDLAKLPISEGASVLVHSSLKAIGFVDGGAKTVIQALVTDIVNQRGGTLVFPTYSILGTMHNTLVYGSTLNNPVFKVNSTKSNLGALPETFRLWPGVIRSIHPTHSFAALGPHAHELLDSHHTCGSNFGPGSPMANMLERDSWLFGIGTNLGNVTMYHCLEEIESDFPLDVYSEDSPLTVICRDADNRDHEVTLSAHDGAVSKTRIDRPENSAIREFFTKHFVDHAGLTWHTVGEAKCWLVSAERFYEESLKLMRRGITIYSSEDELKHFGSRS